MSVQGIPGFLPIMEIVYSPLPAFLVSLSLASIPLLVVQLSVSMQYRDFFKMLNTVNIGNSPFSRTRSSPSAENIFDFIVVGSGSSGSAVAARLSKNYKVLLIEAGGDPHPLTYIPLMTQPLLNQPMIDWQFKTDFLNNSGFSWPNQKMSWPRGRSLGGSSNSNYMVYMRGNPEDFNRWAIHSGDNRWNYNNVQEIFKRIENYHGHWEGSAHHGTDGPMHIEKAQYAPSAEYWLEAGQEVQKRVLDPNAFQSEGFFPLDVTRKGGTRFSTFRGYIEPNLKNENLTIHRYSIATKIHFDDKMRAVGVTYFRHAIKQYSAAMKEIIISCGAINSPKLLMLSGIGPKDHLNSIGIKPLVDLKVGENLQDHVLGMAGPFLLNKNVSFIRSRDITVLSAIEFLTYGKGPFTTSDGLSATAAISSSKSSPNWPDILMMHVGCGIDSKMGDELEKSFGMKRGTLGPYLDYNSNNDSNVVLVAVARPKSRGFIKLRNNDPFSTPIINPNYFSDPQGEDMEVLLEGMQFVNNLFENTKTYKKLGARLVPNSFPGCENVNVTSKAYLECMVRQNTQTMFHPAGTCAMGKSTDPNAVVDSELKVLGTTGLRISDTSIMPFITNANLNAPAIMIGEMCADLIEDTWKTEDQSETVKISNLRPNNYYKNGVGHSREKDYYKNNIDFS